MAITKKQTLILWALLIRPGGAAMQKEIKPDVARADRDALGKAGLVLATKGKRGAYILEVTEKGWGWAGENLGADLPGGSPAGTQILQGWLTKLSAFLAARELTLADFVAARPIESASAPAPANAANAPDIEAQIRTAYLQCTNGAFNQRVFLSKLRERLPEIDRASLDAALRSLHLGGNAELSSTDNPFELTAADRAASLDFKGEAKYVLWIIA